MVWREHTDHNNNCYFCMTPSLGKGLSRKKQNIQYPDIPKTLPVPEAPQEFTLDSDDEQRVGSTSSDKLSMSQESYFAPSIFHEPTSSHNSK